MQHFGQALMSFHGICPQLFLHFCIRIYATTFKLRDWETTGNFDIP